MAATVVTVDGEMIDNLRKAIDDCADRGLQVASKWYACRPFPSIHPTQSHLLPLPLLLNPHTF